MKFLCVPCDTAMKLTKTEEAEPGSLSVIYGCPECGYEMAMLTNVYETQLVRSLGVRIGPAAEALAAAPGDVVASGESAATPAVAAGGGSKCPFAAMMGGRGATEVAGNGLSAGADTIAAMPAPAVAEGLSWTSGAMARLEAIPEMVRPMAKMGIEMVAREQGVQLIDESLLSEARSRFGM